MNKRISLLLAVLMVCALFSGCQSSQDPALLPDLDVPGDETPAVTTSGPTPVPTPTPEPTPTPVPTPTPTPTPIPTPTPDPLDLIFAAEGEEIIEYYYDGQLYDPYADTKHLPDRWFYNSHDLRIDINRVYLPDEKLEYFVADVRVRGDEKPFSIFNNPDKPGTRGRDQYIKAARLSRREGVIFAVNGDYMTFNEKELKGPIIRNGVCYWKGSSNAKCEDTLYFLPDGTMEVMSPGTYTSDELLEMGVEQTLNFGPTLVRDGKALTADEMRNVRGINNPKNSRSALGMLEPNHYIFIVAETLIPHSSGISLPDLALIFEDLGCSVAYNLDGSASACMTFMGNMVNTVINNHESLLGPRPMVDMLAFGHTDDLPGQKDAYYNDGQYNGRD